ALFAIPIDGGEPRRLTSGAHVDRAPRADPAGRFVVFVSDRTGSDQLWRFEADGGEPRLLTALPRGSIGDVAIARDGARLAVVFTPDGPEDDALPLAAALLSDGHDDAMPDAIDGAKDVPATEPLSPRPTPRARVYTRLANREDGRGWLGDGRAHLWCVDAATGHARRLTRGPRDFGAPRWAPDGSAVFATASAVPDAVADLDGTRNAIVRVAVASDGSAVPAPEEIPKPDGLAMAVSVSPRGDAVAYVLGQPDDAMGRLNPVVCVTPLEGGASPRALGAELDRPALDMVLDDLVGAAFTSRPALWSADGACVTFEVADRGAVRLYEARLDGGGGRFRTSDDCAIGSACDVGEGRLVAVRSTRGTFAELVRIDEDGTVTGLTAHNRALTERSAPRVPELVRLSRDGVDCFAYYLPPRGVPSGVRAPAVLYVHGGPHVCYGERLFFEMQWLSDEGYAVLYPNPRGSHSYGDAYTSAIHFHWGEPDAGDHLAFVDWLAARPEVDGDRIAVAGGSYGGYMALELCTRTQRFRTAIAERGLYCWATTVGSSDFGHQLGRDFDGKYPWQDPRPFHDASPIARVDAVRTPMLVVHYEGDLRVGPEQALTLYAALKLRDVPTALVLFPEEDHGMSRGGRIDRRLERLRQIAAWLRRWLA
ncbi:MAG: S9 family peptidase, partial [Deltaproteobacteria bacterium]|nr:S9 family peptidase [Deltaproteobacteria bacterium]